jgi:hypothetical protein
LTAHSGRKFVFEHYPSLDLDVLCDGVAHPMALPFVLAATTKIVAISGHQGPLSCLHYPFGGCCQCSRLVTVCGASDVLGDWVSRFQNHNFVGSGIACHFIFPSNPRLIAVVRSPETLRFFRCAQVAVTSGFEIWDVVAKVSMLAWNSSHDRARAPQRMTSRGLKKGRDLQIMSGFGWNLQSLSLSLLRCLESSVNTRRLHFRFHPGSSCMVWNVYIIILFFQTGIASMHGSVDHLDT